MTDSNKDRYEFLQDKLGDTINTVDTLNGEKNAQVILYGIAGMIMPTGSNTGLLPLESDKEISNNTHAIYVEIDKDNPLGMAITDGKLNVIVGLPTWVFGYIKDIREQGDRKEYLVYPTKNIRVDVR